MNVLEVDLHKLTVSDPFLGQYQQLVRDVVIPYQWDALNDRIPEAEPSHAIENFRIAAGQQTGRLLRHGLSGQRRGEMAGSGCLVTVPEARSRA
ncbi:glycosyl hydrolase [Salmonella enterica subsp. enterica]|nr:glycosyl hydrolase [Salmonella enterica subsp. enterica]